MLAKLVWIFETMEFVLTPVLIVTKSIVCLSFLAVITIDIVFPDFEDKRPESIIRPQKLVPTSYEIIDTEEKLNSLISSLRNESVIAFDVREHRYRSYLGFVCVIAVSRLVDYFAYARISSHFMLILSFLLQRMTILSIQLLSMTISGN